MLCSDSDSEFDYPEGANDSDASCDLELQGRLALGIDPEESRSYDFRSEPTNGSQYLLRVMREKRNTPKVAFIDPSSLPAPAPAVVNTSLIKTTPTGAGEMDFVTKFLEACAFPETSTESEPSSSRILRSKIWRDKMVSEFSLVRSGVEQWQYKIESGELRITCPLNLPKDNENTHWLKFCYGQAFLKLAESSKIKTPEETLSNFFLDLYDESTAREILQQALETPPKDPPKPIESETQQGEGDGDAKSQNPVNNTISGQSSSSDDLEEDSPMKSTSSVASSSSSVNQIKLGHKPVMSILLSMGKTERDNLVKWHLQWLKKFGFVNECQGRWLYALLASLPKPIDPTVVADLRDITRILISIRVADQWESMLLHEIQTNSKNEKLLDFINTLNLLVYCVADYFQQKDLIMK